MQLNTIVIACFKKDVHLMRICVASVRYWYPDIELWLLKDTWGGDFSTEEIEKYFDVKTLQTPGLYHGWGFAKFEVFFSPLKRYLLLDSDTILLGKVIEDLSRFDEDFIVTGVQTDDQEEERILRDYVKTQKILSINPGFRYPGYGINTGQIVITNGVIRQDDFDVMVIKKEGRVYEKYPEIFNYADQGVINYVLACKKQQGETSVRYHHFWIWPGEEIAKTIDLDSIKRKEGMPFVMHWAGIKPVDFRKFLRIDLLSFFEDLYYKKIPGGSGKRKRREWKRLFILQLKLAKYKLLRRKYQ